jgi:hypothetical protein
MNALRAWRGLPCIPPKTLTTCRLAFSSAPAAPPDSGKRVVKPQPGISTTPEGWKQNRSPDRSAKSTPKQRPVESYAESAGRGQPARPSASASAHLYASRIVCICAQTLTSFAFIGRFPPTTTRSSMSIGQCCLLIWVGFPFAPKAAANLFQSTSPCLGSALQWSVASKI